MFSAKQRKTECKLKNRNYQELGLFANMQKVVFSLGGWFCFFLFVFVRSLEKKRPPKGYFPAFFEVFSLLFPQRPVFKILLFFLFCFFLVFLLSSLSKFHFFFAFCPSTPFCFLGGGLLLSLFFAFSFVNVCLFLWNNFPQHPFFQTQLALVFDCLFFLLFLFVFVIKFCIFAFCFMLALFWYVLCC